MPVVIDDLDVEVEASPPPTESTVSGPAASPAELARGDLDQVARALAARYERVRAD